MTDHDQGKVRRRCDDLPAEIGALLMAAGLTTGMLPPRPGPFDMMLVVSGGLALRPRGFQTLEGWAARRFPERITSACVSSFVSSTT